MTDPSLERVEAGADDGAAVEPDGRPSAATATLELTDPSLYINRELSWLDFNDRVLQLAEDESLPLIERLKFLAIFVTNLDEFFMIRVAGVHDQVDARIDARGPDGLLADRGARADRRHACASSTAVMHGSSRRSSGRSSPSTGSGSSAASRATRSARDDRAPLPRPHLPGPDAARGRPGPPVPVHLQPVAEPDRAPARSRARSRRVRAREGAEGGAAAIRRDLEGHVHPARGHHRPHLDDAVPRDGDRQLRPVPGHARRRLRGLRRGRRPAAGGRGRAAAPALRRGRAARGRAPGWTRRCAPADRLARASTRSRSTTSRVCSTSATCGRSPGSKVTPSCASRPGRRSPTRRSARVPATSTSSPTCSPRCARATCSSTTPTTRSRRSVERFVKQAVDDPNVLAIKMTVYRTSDDSALVPSLIEAAEKGKQAVCMVELKARFDERQNIRWSRALEEVGAHVVHGIPGLKTHAKAILVVRRERDGIRHYVMIGTGNFHAKNARLYEDFGLFTTDPELGQEVANLFNTLTGYGHPERERKVLVAPNWMRVPLIEEIDRTIAAHEAGRAGADRDEDELARRPADHRGAVPRLAGRRPDRPQRPRDLLPEARASPASARRSTSSPSSGASSSTPASTRSIAATESSYYIGSADLMPRNLDKRVELLTPVENKELQAELEDTLERCLADDTFAWTLDAGRAVAAPHRADPQRASRVDGAHARAGLEPRASGSRARAGRPPAIDAQRSPARDRRRRGDRVRLHQRLSRHRQRRRVLDLDPGAVAADRGRARLGAQLRRAPSSR